MTKKLILFLAAAVFLGLKASAYEAFDGRYTYTGINQNYSAGISKQDGEALFIVDFSGSMNSTIDGVTLKQHAVDAIRHILENTDASSRIGLRIFGVPEGNYIEYTPSGYKYNMDVLCRSSSLVFPPAPYNRAGMLDTLQSEDASGVTPIYYSLKQAVQNDFTPDYTTFKHIILVTDGAENCGGDPCRYIKELMSMRSDFKIDVIGITLDNNAYSQLKCISDAGRGSFYDVKSPADFKVKFMQAYMNPAPHQINKPAVSFSSGIEYRNYIIEFNN